MMQTQLDDLFVRKGDVVFMEGEAGDAAFLVESGSLEVAVAQEGGSVRLAVIGPGEIVGEMAIIDKQPRTATVTALEDSRLLAITRDHIARRVAEADPVLSLCLSVVMERFRSTLSHLRGESIDTLSHNAISGEAPTTKDAAIGEIRRVREIEEGIRHRQFELHYQPIVDLASGVVAGLESLVRWRHPTRGMTAPSEFIPIAEACGLIVPLSRLCLAEACLALARMQATGFAECGLGDDLFVSVNVSAQDFSDGDFVGSIERTIDKTGADPSRIKLEITESILMERPDRAVAALEQCRLKGLSIAIDDFGTGYSSLGYLHRLPVDTLKIDRSFVLSMHEDDRSMKIIQSVLRLAKQLDIPVVVEGIETARDAAVLTDLGCEYGQGYYFAKPMPLNAALALIRAIGPRAVAKAGLEAAG